jgi:aminoglycoside phosphotransferase (APT) family kinase protein
VAQGTSPALTRRLIPADALERVPGYGPGAHVAALAGGTVNRSFVVETAAGRYFLRLHETTSLALGADHAREARLQAAAAEVGLAPPLVYADPGHRFAISEFLAGRVWTEADFADASQLRKLGATLRRVHEVLPPIAAPFDLPSLLESFVQRISAAVPAERGMLAELVERARIAEPAAASHTRKATLFHSDPHHSNLIERDDGRLQLVDWEYAAVGDPLYDLACVLAYYPAASAHARELLESSGLADRATPDMLAHASWLYRLLGYLWYRARRLDIPPSEADLAAERGMLERLG